MRSAQQILAEAEVIAVVGASREAWKPSHSVPLLMLRHGWKIIPVNPYADEVFGLKVVPTLADIGEPAGEAEIAAAAKWVAARVEQLFRQGLPWRPGAPEALRTTRELGLRTALVTSTIRSLTEVALETIGRDSFEVTVCGDEVDGRNKPDPEPYLRAARLLGVDPAECVAIEDSPTGVAAAEAAGCAVIAIPCEVPVPPGPHRTLYRSLSEVRFDRLGRLLRRAE